MFCLMTYLFALLLSIKTYLTPKRFCFEIQKLSRQDLDRIRLCEMHKSRASAFYLNYYTLIYQNFDDSN